MAEIVGVGGAIDHDMATPDYATICDAPILSEREAGAKTPPLS